MKIFWSWQSDRTQRVCRHLVKEALEAAAQRVAVDLELDESNRPEVDHDTRGEAGMVDIAATILRKIDESTVFVADMTPIARAEQGKLVANPNVLLELGYAMRAIGPERIILVANTAWGGTPEDLPFDLRHRRGPLTYRLSREATDEEVTTAKRVLAEELASALSASMGLVIKTRDAAAKLSGYPARKEDPSVWFAAGQRLKHRDFFGGSSMREVEVAEEPRAYMRIIPAGWQSEKPDRVTVHKAPNELRIAPLGRWGNGDGGVNELGVLSTEVDKREGNLTCARTATQWFVDTGEIWGFDQKAFDTQADKLMLAHVYLIRQWRDFLRSGIALLRHLGAAPPFRVEAGVTGLMGVHWPARFSSERVSALEPSAIHQRQSREWNDEEQLAFITHAYNRVLAAFGLPKVTQSEVFAQLPTR